VKDILNRGRLSIKLVSARFKNILKKTDNFKITFTVATIILNNSLTFY